MHGRVLNVYKILSQHPCGDLAALIDAGEDATSEHDMTHSLDEKSASNAIIGVIGSGKAKKAEGAAKSVLLVAFLKCDVTANWKAWRDWNMEAFDDTPRVLWVKVQAYVNACHNLVLSTIYGVCAAISFAKNFKISNDRAAPTRSAALVIFEFKGPGEFNGLGYFCVRFFLDRPWIPG